MAHDSEKGEGVAYEGLGTAEAPFVVRWLPGEKENPLNWSGPKRWLTTLAFSLATACVAFGSSSYSGAMAQMEDYFATGSEVTTLGLSVYVLGFAFGPLLWGPLSEMYGRRIVHLCVYTAFFLFSLGTALVTNIEGMIICRFFAGFTGASCINNTGAIMSDIWSASERSVALSIYMTSLFLGPVLGPVVGGFMGQKLYWRWIFRLETILAGAILLLSALIPESYGPTLLHRRALTLSKETGEVYVSEYDLKVGATESVAHKLAVAISRPFNMLFKESIVLAFAVYAAVCCKSPVSPAAPFSIDTVSDGEMYAMFGGYGIIFKENRGWTGGLAGLPFLGIGVGNCLAVLINFYVNKAYGRALIKAGGSLPPEARLPSCILGGVCVPIGLFWFAWTVQPSVHFMVPIVGSIFFGLGLGLVFLTITNYMVDAYLQFAASALAANTVLRSIFGAVFPMFTDQMFHNLGSNWALTVFAFLALALVPVPFLFYKFGARIRATSSYAPGHKPPQLSKVPTQHELDEAEQVGELDLRSREEESRV
ncbi:MFS transporter [Pseudohyphozyma bogoriensis]|nr:MFS transporter [Pseudohyphozyma bogoriensis]